MKKNMEEAISKDSPVRASHVDLCYAKPAASGSDFFFVVVFSPTNDHRGEAFS